MEKQKREETWDRVLRRCDSCQWHLHFPLCLSLRSPIMIAPNVAMSFCRPHGEKELFLTSLSYS